MEYFYGTNHFVDFESAVKYYADYHYPNTHHAVSSMIQEGRICLGKPIPLDNERVVLIDNGTRYAIQKN